MIMSMKPPKGFSMKRDDFPGSMTNEDAWIAFVACKSWPHHLAAPDEWQMRWRWFLLGWHARFSKYEEDRKAGKYSNPLIKVERKK